VVCFLWTGPFLNTEIGRIEPRTNLLDRVVKSIVHSNGLEGGRDVTRARVRNPSSRLAFFIHLRVNKNEHGVEILPVLRQDNCVELTVGEERQVTTSYSKDALQDATPYRAVNGWKIAAGSVAAGR